MEPPPAGPEGEGTTPLPQFRSSPIAPQSASPNTKSKLTAGGSGAEGRDGGDGKKSEGGELHGCDTVTGKEKSGFSQGGHVKVPCFFADARGAPRVATHVTRRLV